MSLFLEPDAGALNSCPGYLCVKFNAPFKTLQKCLTFIIRLEKTNDRACTGYFEFTNSSKSGCIRRPLLLCACEFLLHKSTKELHADSVNRFFRFIGQPREFLNTFVHTCTGITFSLLTGGIIIWLKPLQKGGNMDTRKIPLLFLTGEYFYNFVFFLHAGFVIYL